MDIQKIKDVIYPKWDRGGMNVNDIMYFTSDSVSDKYYLFDYIILDYLFNYGENKDVFKLDREYNIKGKTNFSDYMRFEYDLYITPTSVETEYDVNPTLFKIKINGNVNPTKSTILYDGKVYTYYDYYVMLLSMERKRGSRTLADNFEFGRIYEIIIDYFNELFENNNIEIEIESVYFPMGRISEDVLSEIKDIKRKMGIL